MAHRILSQSGARRADGLEHLRWNARQLRSLVRDPAQFIISEIQHTRYTLTDTFLHRDQHRLSGLRALLDGRPVDAISLQAIGDLDTVGLDFH